MIKWLKMMGVLIIGLVLFAIALLGTALAFPSPMFAYSASYKQISFHSDAPIADNAQSVLKEISERIARSPIKLNEMPLSLYVVNSDWKRQFLWTATSRAAGGFVVVPVTRQHSFLSGADFGRGRLISPSGNTITTPRTLAYFSAHELTHVMEGEVLGVIDYHLMPEWVREGLADYVAMASEQPFKSLYAEIGERDADLAMMNKYGVYAPYRLLVGFLLDEQKWPIEKLLKSRLSKEEARAVMREHLSLN